MALVRKSKAKDVVGVESAGLIGLERAGHLHPVLDWAGHRRYDEDELKRVRDALRAGELAPDASKWDHLRNRHGNGDQLRKANG